MCSPTAMMGISLATTLIGTGVSTYGQIQQGKAQAEAAEYNAKLAEREAQMANEQSKDAYRRGQVEQENFRRQYEAYKGEQTSALAASGVQLDSGSPLQLLADTAEAGKLDMETIKYNTEQEARGYQYNAQTSLSQASMFRAQGSQAQSASYLSAGSSLLSGLGSAGMQYYTYKKQ